MLGGNRWLYINRVANDRQLTPSIDAFAENGPGWFVARRPQRWWTSRRLSGQTTRTPIRPPNDSGHYGRISWI